jgi:hypothetical protein
MKLSLGSVQKNATFLQIVAFSRKAALTPGLSGKAFMSENFLPEFYNTRAAHKRLSINYVSRGLKNVITDV